MRRENLSEKVHDVSTRGLIRTTNDFGRFYGDIQNWLTAPILPYNIEGRMSVAFEDRNRAQPSLDVVLNRPDRVVVHLVRGLRNRCRQGSIQVTTEDHAHQVERLAAQRSP